LEEEGEDTEKIKKEILEVSWLVVVELKKRRRRSR
jgi:hypothetical protein